MESQELRITKRGILIAVVCVLALAEAVALLVITIAK